MLPLSYTSPPLSILVADDETTVLLVLETTLREDGHKVGVACDGIDALRLFREKHWDLVLTDRSMPGMDGDDLAAAIKELSPRTPVVMVTGTPPRVPPAAVDAIVGKPFSRAKLVEAITRALAEVARPGAFSGNGYSAAA